jgi:hypothetical protein
VLTNNLILDENKVTRKRSHFYSVHSVPVKLHSPIFQLFEIVCPWDKSTTEIVPFLGQNKIPKPIVSVFVLFGIGWNKFDGTCFCVHSCLFNLSQLFLGHGLQSRFQFRCIKSLS